MESMICPTCESQGLKSITEMGLSIGKDTYDEFYEDGKYHIHDKTMQRLGWTCSNGHAWITDRHHKCPHCDFIKT
jgi:Zn finger protein HypA/HybF involved in hydrogenase expression